MHVCCCIHHEQQPPPLQHKRMVPLTPTSQNYLEIIAKPAPDLPGGNRKALQDTGGTETEKVAAGASPRTCSARDRTWHTKKSTPASWCQRLPRWTTCRWRECRPSKPPGDSRSLLRTCPSSRCHREHRRTSTRRPRYYSVLLSPVDILCRCVIRK